MKYLVTGAAGFIGAKVCELLCSKGDLVVGVDNLNDYYDVSLKISRLDQLASFANFKFVKMDVSNRNGVLATFSKERFDRVIHLAAQAGVRHSMENPFAYTDSNVTGFLAILEGCRHHCIKHLVYASSSSVYGMNEEMPFKVSEPTDHPISLYAATKKMNELMAHTYSHLYGIPTTGLRFFTVYGPWGRPDMALFKFTKDMLSGKPIDVYNNGLLSRDFTYIDDIAEGVIRVADVVPVENVAWRCATGSPADSSAPYRVFNIGNGKPIKIVDFIQSLEQALGVKAIKNMMPMQSGDVYATWADTEDLFATISYRPSMKIEQGIQNFVEWYRSYYQFLDVKVQ
ncbi:NAD-dependent epimerase [Aeromonas veronii]|uniref:NAD-dependent epimerase n=1 Tax=Aeromonas veronii TaxID=654 RepID=UPI0013029B20|nr:NAD-dependent epimerase [Aeromonas veronii]EKP0246921.1 NAD-dependent epimerase [Aeromonas veronii]KAE9626103.1 NAD-dependent epimerase/dehydratase family protein [Aeromonas veronii]KAE9637753.1 NAD-dependent epimerase/dehydratase family protein [Aeromonas veronii]MCF7744913.1 NAD-dependent epimerase [Aeromonas veronii]WOE83295.1 NAD-dependent epimerase [Aeromonas veronii]